jgi:DNA replication protein DnaC
MEQLKYQMKSLRLSGMASVLMTRLQEAKANELPYEEFIAALLQDELDLRKERLLNRRLKAARFPFQKTLDDFDFTFNPSINKRKILELAGGRFVVKSEGVLLLGPPGVGKSHLAIALGMQAIQNGYSVRYISAFDMAEDLAESALLGIRKDMVKKFCKPDVLILDEFGMKNLPGSAAEDLLEVFHRRYLTGSTIIATNRPVNDWGKILGDNATTSAILDRFLENIHLIKISGRSYRLKNNKNNQSAVDGKPEQEV